MSSLNSSLRYKFPSIHNLTISKETFDKFPILFCYLFISCHFVPFIILVFRFHGFFCTVWPSVHFSLILHMYIVHHFVYTERNILSFLYIPDTCILNSAYFDLCSIILFDLKKKNLWKIKKKNQTQAEHWNEIYIFTPRKYSGIVLKCCQRISIEWPTMNVKWMYKNLRLPFDGIPKKECVK